MGMQQKLTKAYIQGCHDTWEILEYILKRTKHIGPVTEARIINEIKKVAEEEKI